MAQMLEVFSSCMVSAVDTDDLARQGAKTSAVMVLTQLRSGFSTKRVIFVIFLSLAVALCYDHD